MHVPTHNTDHTSVGGELAQSRDACTQHTIHISRQIAQACPHTQHTACHWFLFCPLQRSVQLRDMLYARLLYTRKILRLCSAFDRLHKNLGIHRKLPPPCMLRWCTVRNRATSVLTLHKRAFCPSQNLRLASVIVLLSK